MIKTFLIWLWAKISPGVPYFVAGLIGFAINFSKTKLQNKLDLVRELATAILISSVIMPGVVEYYNLTLKVGLSLTGIAVWLGEKGLKYVEDKYIKDKRSIQNTHSKHHK